MRVAIVVPYFQREAGILCRCLTSVAKQDSSVDYHVFVVDDASPVSAVSELERMDPGFRPRITCLTRENGGPAKARNTALDHIATQDFSQIAFLDSDDEWEPFHLANALSLLGGTADFYFADFRHIDSERSAFEKAIALGELDLSDHEQVGGEPNYLYRGDLVEQTIVENLIGTPTVVYNTLNLGHIRFETDYYFAGEDYRFWIEAARTTDKIAFSTRVSCRCGRGVNVYSASGWGSENALERIRDELHYLSCTVKQFPLSKRGEARRRDRLRALKSSFFRELLHRLVRRKRIRPRTLLEIARLLWV